MAYRKIEQRTWSDEKYLALSRPLPNARDLWIHLMAGPYTTSLPGLLHVGQLALAEDLEWLPEQLPEPFREQFLERFGVRSPEPFLEAFAELEKSGMAKANWSKRIIYLPNAARYNLPANPNVVKGWKVHWDLLPQCPLKDEAFQGLRNALQAKPKCLKEFDRTFGNRLANRFETVPETVCQTLSEQEQEQEQEINTPLTPKGGTGEPNGKAPQESRAEQLADAWIGALKRTRGGRPGDKRADVVIFFEELLRLGLHAEDLSVEIARPMRDKTEQLFRLKERLLEAGAAPRAGPGEAPARPSGPTAEEVQAEALRKNAEMAKRFPLPGDQQTGGP